jgi:hypothetical protein
MPDAYGNLKGSGWTRKREAGWERAFHSRVDRIIEEDVEVLARLAIGAHADVPVTSEEDDANRDKPPTGR